jgi:hypothetical protein
MVETTILARYEAVFRKRGWVHPIISDETAKLLHAAWFRYLDTVGELDRRSTATAVG